MARILSIDDEPGMLELIRLVLESAGYESLHTGNEQEALSILYTQPIDLFTQDLMRPGKSGAEFLGQMKSDERLRGIPVLHISAESRDIHAQALQWAGLDIDHDLDGYLQKPFGPKQLLDIVEAILQKHSIPLPPEEMRIRARARWKV